MYASSCVVNPEGFGLTLQAVQPSAAKRIRFITPAPLTNSGGNTLLWFALGAAVVGSGTYLYLRGRS